MANDDDPTTATPASQTQPLPPTHERAPSPPSKATTGWRPGQVAVVAFLALLLGGAGGALVYFLIDENSTEDSDLATEPTTTTSTTTTDESSASSSNTTKPGPDRTTDAPGATSGRRSQNQGGQTAVGNSIFTATYQSNEDRSTGAIDVEDDWKIRWDVPTGAVTIEVLDASGDVVEMIDAQGQGERTFAEGGTYEVEIDTDGARYTVVVTDGP
ncbi:MAG TPA: hypothetical protein VGV93_13650 [Acidimicrobiales bacterium]|nr:hypothetical protein [Acidimicrobiales bacterium]